MNRTAVGCGKYMQRCESTMDLYRDKSIVRVFGMVGSTRFELVTPAV